MNIQSFILQTLTTLLTSGLVSTFIIKKLERNDTKYNYGKIKALVFLEEIYPRYTFNTTLNRQECIKKLNEFAEEIKSYKLTAFLFELYDDALFLVALDEEKFDNEYKLFQIRYQKTVKIFRNRVGRYAVPAKIIEGDYNIPMLFGGILMIPLAIYIEFLSSTWIDSLKIFILFILSFMFIIGFIMIIATAVLTLKNQINLFTKKRVSRSKNKE